MWEQITQVRAITVAVDLDRLAEIPSVRFLSVKLLPLPTPFPLCLVRKYYVLCTLKS